MELMGKRRWNWPGPGEETNSWEEGGRVLALMELYEE